MSDRTAPSFEMPNTTLTAGELRRQLADLPDDTPVSLSQEAWYVNVSIGLPDTSSRVTMWST